MVDFQSRDTRRGPADADEGETDEDAGAPSGDGSATAAADESAPEAETGYAVVSVAREPTIDDDPAGEAAVAAIEAAGERVVQREAIRPEYDGVQSVVGSLADRRDVAAMVTVGATGVEPHDVTVDAVEPLLEKRLPGFGELFRAREEVEVGTAVIGTRATAGLIEGVPVFCLPGVPEGARRGVRDLVVAEAGRLAGLADADGD